jgi:hypothetical protein
MKSVHFVGTSRDDLRQFPDSAQETAGFQLFKVQQGKEPDDWKPMPTVGLGVQEIRVGMNVERFEYSTWPSSKKRSMSSMCFRSVHRKQHMLIEASARAAMSI